MGESRHDYTSARNANFQLLIEAKSLALEVSVATEAVAE